MPSFEAYLVSWIVWWNFKGAFSSAAGFRRRIEDDRRSADARPPAHLQKQLMIEERRVGGCAVYEASAKSERPNRARVLYLHGGSFVFEMSAAHWELVAALAERLHAVVSVAVFPLGPEHSLMEMYEAVRPVYDELAAAAAEEEGGMPFYVVGDSTGATMALGLTQRALLRRRRRRKGGRRRSSSSRGIEMGTTKTETETETETEAEAEAEAGTEKGTRTATQAQAVASRLVLLSPWLDLTLQNPEARLLAKADPCLDMPGLEEAVRIVCPDDVAPEDPLASPLYGELDELPPTLVYAGAAELLAPDIRRFVAKAKEKGREVELVEGEGMVHCWPLAGAALPEAEEALEKMVGWLQQTRPSRRRGMSLFGCDAF